MSSLISLSARPPPPRTRPRSLDEFLFGSESRAADRGDPRNWRSAASGIAEGVPEARQDRPRRDPEDPRRAGGRGQEGSRLVRRHPDAAGRQQDLPDAGAGTDGRQPAHDRSGELGADGEPQLQPQPADRTAGARGRLQAGGAGHHRGPEAALHGPRPAAARVQPGSEREGGAVPHHRRAGRRGVDPRADQPHRGQGLDRAHAHHQHPVALQPAGCLGGDPDAAQGSEQADPPGGAQRAGQDGRPDRGRPGHASCCATRTSKSRTARSTSWCAPRIRTR